MTAFEQSTATGSRDDPATPQDRIGESTGSALRREFPPDPSADAVLDGLIDQLRSIPWARIAEEGPTDARH